MSIICSNCGNVGKFDDHVQTDRGECPSYECTGCGIYFYGEPYTEESKEKLKQEALKSISFEVIEMWLDELYRTDMAISLPAIPYDYHQLYKELVRREQEQQNSGTCYIGDEDR